MKKHFLHIEIPSRGSMYSWEQAAFLQSGQIDSITQPQANSSRHFAQVTQVGVRNPILKSPEEAFLLMKSVS